MNTIQIVCAGGILFFFLLAIVVCGRWRIMRKLRRDEVRRSEGLAFKARLRGMGIMS